MAEPPVVSNLIRRARQGDAECRDRLFELCRSYLGFAARAQVESWLRVKVDASDLVQQTLLEAHRDFDRFDGASEQEWLAWLRKILAHNVSDFIRRYRGTAKRQVRREVPFRDPGASGPAAGAPEPAAPDRTPSQQLALVDDQLRVTAALAELAPDYQEVVVLRNLERLPFAEVAERMGRSRPAVQMLWMRAIRRLQEMLGEEDAERPGGGE
ncbi:MAG: sigma-70 family RNA polymerase sigma factor [Thermoguttaceae bacterium]|jgi:RNA polymerase sigma-70 factor (ECF subfamily)